MKCLEQPHDSHPLNSSMLLLDGLLTGNVVSTQNCSVEHGYGGSVMEEASSCIRGFQSPTLCPQVEPALAIIHVAWRQSQIVFSFSN